MNGEKVLKLDKVQVKDLIKKQGRKFVDDLFGEKEVDTLLGTFHASDFNSDKIYIIENEIGDFYKLQNLFSGESKQYGWISLSSTGSLANGTSDLQTMLNYGMRDNHTLHIFNKFDDMIVYISGVITSKVG